MSNLLVVDWDYFFPNPLEGLNLTPDGYYWLFDWGHKEGTALDAALWPYRAAGFWHHGFALPMCEGYEGFWDRFTITDDAVCEVSDSNLYSGIANGEAKFEHVWLFDAHHDLYRVSTETQLWDWAKQGTVTCEDWMWAHHIRGAKLHWRIPRWHSTKSTKILRHAVPKWVGLDARKDDMGALDTRMVFDTVSICRSGSWTPPWCDEQFAAFVAACPVPGFELVDEMGNREPPNQLVRGWEHVPWGRAEAQRQLDQILRTDELVKSGELRDEIARQGVLECEAERNARLVRLLARDDVYLAEYEGRPWVDTAEEAVDA